MNVRELISVLMYLPPETPIVVQDDHLRILPFDRPVVTRDSEMPGTPATINVLNPERN